ncbi:thioredoxin family protein [Rheinheimera sp. WS51]|uniref:thioredoxin family protein n=1 Tax=Rheinheimera sp. WS51 TaxID=3425886 RepID=UPI003D917336
MTKRFADFIAGFFAVLFCVVWLVGCQTVVSPSADAVAVLPEYTFVPDDNYLLSVEQAQARAIENNKLLLVVLGAQWCHDSTGLAKNFSHPAMQEILKQRFETVFVDVGYFEDKHDVAQRYGYPAYFATPTVLVVEPNSSTLLNRASIPKWQAADNVPFNEFITYFQTIGQTPPLTSANWQLHPKLAKFSQQQVQRLKSAFDHLRPIWRDVRTGVTEDSAELEAVALEVWQFRLQLQQDLEQLYQSLESTNGQSLVFPSYDKFSWQD